MAARGEEGATSPVLKVKDFAVEDQITDGSSEDRQGPNTDSDSDGIENYDDLEVDPDTLVTNVRSREDDVYQSVGGVGLHLGEQEPADKTRPNGLTKRNSIQIRLEKTKEKGKYVVRTDDPLIKEILRRGIEREEEAAGKRSRRFRFRDLVFTRQFTTFDRQNPASSESPFFGFFTLFWLAMVLLFCQVSLRNWREHGSILGRNQIMKMMFSRDVFVLGLTDAVMCLACLQGYFLQKLIFMGYINWARSGWIIQNVWQSFYLGTIIWWTYHREWPWTHTVFAVLHGLVFLMKQHSYNFYNGYLSGVYRRRALLKQKLAQLESTETQSPFANKRDSGSQTQPLSTGVEVNGINSNTVTTEHIRRPPLGARTSTNLSVERSDVASVAAAIEAGIPISRHQMEIFGTVICLEIDELTKELNGKSTDGSNAYPNNITMSNIVEYICFPTVVYELEYPRQDSINWWYVAEKTTATFGVLCVMMVISQAFIYPSVARTVEMKAMGMTLAERWHEFPIVVSDMLFPLLIEQLLTWYLIWECILNVIAEVTRFADRGFYGAWWNSVTFDQYARDWNRPVHNFLLRHVYHSSISTFHLTRTTATFVTFLLSALVHEMVMAVMFKKIRGYLFCMQLLQMPLVMMSQSKLLKGRVILGNVIFWLGLFIGPSFLTGLYLVT